MKTASIGSADSPRESGQHRRRMRLVLRDVVGADQHAEVLIQLATPQSAPGQCVSLAGHNREAHTRFAEISQSLGDSGVGFQQPVVMRVGVGAVRVNHLRRVMVVARELPQLGS